MWSLSVRTWLLSFLSLDSQLLRRKRLFWFIVLSVSVSERWVRGLRWDSVLWKGVCSGVNLKLHVSTQREEDQAHKALAISMLQWPADILEGTLSEGCTTQQQHHAEDQHLFLFKGVFYLSLHVYVSLYTHMHVVYTEARRHHLSCSGVLGCWATYWGTATKTGSSYLWAISLVPWITLKIQTDRKKWKT